MISGIKAVATALQNATRFNSWAKRINDRVKQLYNKFGPSSSAYQNAVAQLQAHEGALNTKSKQPYPQLSTGKQGFNYFSKNAYGRRAMMKIENIDTAGQVMKHEKKRLKQEGIKNPTHHQAILRNKKKQFIEQNLNDAFETFYSYDTSGADFGAIEGENPTIDELFNWINNVQKWKKKQRNPKEANRFEDKHTPFWKE